MSCFCLVHGAWHDGSCWGGLVEELERRGQECLTPTLPLEDSGATFADYAEVVLEDLSGASEPILVGHSMSSAVIALVAVRRPVSLLVYLCPAMAGFAELSGEPNYRRAGYRPPPVDSRGRSWWPPERAVEEIYGRVDTRLAESLATRLRPQPQTPFDAPYPLERPPAVPSALLYAREDEIFDERWSRWIARELLHVHARELPGGHFPMLERPSQLADELEACVADLADDEVD
jgi:pimeloyl-ACP methyl ester carboxylesterase